MGKRGVTSDDKFALCQIQDQSPNFQPVNFNKHRGELVTTLMIRDELSSGEVINEFTLEVLDDLMTVRELIRSRVYEEVRLFNFRKPDYFTGLVQPSDAEVALNGHKCRAKRTVDWQKQYERALDAFGENGFIILVDEQQVERLDQVIQLRAGTQVSFLKLVPLVGG
ncbi:MAG: hypothetical protein ACYC69_05580 [Thermodesulfovibrionales bacterium]